ncbi:MAG: single-stranded-DNA-specific exonuclease RecJ [Desulfarculales bacterium]|jgi:single-stranded-DNA-specific exonuclease|nr:single-stranded-DNA-specific exonuclease RecJ [Desulfarculales bacterium]
MADTPRPPRQWRVRVHDLEIVETLARELRLPLWQAELLAHRGIDRAETARAFLNPSLASLTPPFTMHNIDLAADLIREALQARETIGIAGDYDVDGVTATALLLEFLEQVGGKAVWRLPHRLHDGYGLSLATVHYFQQQGVKLLITVDCGISDHEAVAAARSLGMRVLVTDHHPLPPGPLVPAQAVINPHQPQCPFSPHLAGVGLAFYLAAAARARLQQAGMLKNPPNLRQVLDLVALGTCADVVPLRDENRILVNEGLKVINDLRRPGLRALSRLSRPPSSQGKPLDSQDLIFYLNPCLNAAGRMDHPETALNLLLCQDEEKALLLARSLDELNRERRRRQEEIYRQAVSLWRESASAGQYCLVLAAPGWHRGILGIVAGRMAELSGRPCLMLSLDAEGRAAGSGRSVPGVDLRQALADQAPLLDRYGGHSMAVGLSLAQEHVDSLRRNLNQALSGQEQTPPRLWLDGEAELSQMGGQSLRYLESLSPFGAGNPEPCLLFRRVEVSILEAAGRFRRLNLRQSGHSMRAVMFASPEQSLPGRACLCDLACTLRPNGRYLDLLVEDWRPAA